jgi:hypothetical protein
MIGRSSGVHRFWLPRPPLQLDSQKLFRPRICHRDEPQSRPHPPAGQGRGPGRVHLQGVQR